MGTSDANPKILGQHLENLCVDKIAICQLQKAIRLDFAHVQHWYITTSQVLGKSPMCLKANTMGGPILSMLELLQEGENVFRTEKGFKVNWLWFFVFLICGSSFLKVKTFHPSRQELNQHLLRKKPKETSPSLATDNGWAPARLAEDLWAWFHHFWQPFQLGVGARKIIAWSGGQQLPLKCPGLDGP